MDTSGSGKLEQLAEHFAKKTSLLKHFLQLQSALTRPESQKVVASIQSELAEIENLLSQLRYELEERRKTLRTVEVVNINYLQFSVITFWHCYILWQFYTYIKMFAFKMLLHFKICDSFDGIE